MTQLSIQAALVAALSPLVGGRVYARTFIQGNGKLPAWPAIRLVVADITPDVTICGDGGEETADYRVQLDVVLEQNKGEAAFLALRSSVLQAVKALGPAYVWDGQGDSQDFETKTNRCRLDYLIHLSSQD